MRVFQICVAVLLGITFIHAKGGLPVEMSRAIHATFEEQSAGFQPDVMSPVVGQLSRTLSSFSSFKNATITVEDRPEFGGNVLFFDDHITNRSEVAHSGAYAWFGIAEPVTEQVSLRFRFMFIKDPNNCFFTVQGLARAPVLTVMARGADRRLVVLSKTDGVLKQTLHPESLRADTPSEIAMKINLQERTWTLTLNNTPISGVLGSDAASSFYALQIHSVHGGTVQFAVDDIEVEVPTSEFRAESIAHGEDQWRPLKPVPGFTLETLTEFPAPATQWTFSTTNFSLTAVTVAESAANLLTHPGGVFLRDGEADTVLTARTERVSCAAEHIKVAQEYADNLCGTTTVSAERGAIRWRIELKNSAVKERWIELHLALPFGAKQNASYFDGYTTHRADAPAIWRTQLPQTLPVSFLYNSGDPGIAFGVPPDAVTSILQNGFIDGVARYLTRLVVPPQHPIVFEFILFTSGSTFGYRDAMQGYVQRYPTAFQPHPRVDPRMTDNKRADSLQLNHYSGGASNAVRAIDMQSTFGGIEWSFAITKRGGDLYGHQEFWNFPQSPDIQTNMIKRLKSSGGLLDFFDCEKYHAGRKTMWDRANYRGNIALTHYMIDFVEEGLVQEFDLLKCAYPDTDTVSAMRSRWGFVYCSRLYHVYPWANAYEMFMRRDIPLLVKELNLPGMAFDNFFESPSAPLYRGSLDRYMPGWSYDAKGKCLSRLLAYREIPELCHSLTNADGHAVGVFANGVALASTLSFAYPDCWLTETKATKLLLETGIGKGRWGRENYKHARFFAGSKPIYQHSYVGNDLGDLLDWELLSPVEIGELVDDFYKDLTSWYYQAGVLPSRVYIASIGAVRDEIPWIHNVLSRGFQPVPIISGDALVERARYGEGGQSAVVLTSRANAPATYRETIHNAYLSDGCALPFNLKGGVLSFEMEQGNTAFNVSLDPLENKIVTLNVMLDLPYRSTARGKTQTIVTPTEQRYRITLTVPTPLSTGLKVTADPGYAVTSATCNGIAPDKGMIHLLAGENTILVTTTSTDYRSPISAFLFYPYDKASVVLVGPDSKRKAATAQNLQDFILVRLGATAEIRSEPPETGSYIRVGTIREFGRTGVWVDGETLVVSGKNDFDAQQRAWFFMRFLERHDPRFALSMKPAQGGTKQSKAMLTRAGLLNKVSPRLDRAGLDRVPWQKYLRSDLKSR